MTPSGSTYSHKYVGPTSPDWSSVVARMSVSHSKLRVAISFSGLSYVRGSPIPVAHFRRYLAELASRGALSGGTTPAVPCHTDPGGNPCTPAGGRPVCRMESFERGSPRDHPMVTI